MAESKSLAGRYRTLVWHLRGHSKIPPGGLVDLTHEEAERAIAQSTAIPALLDVPSDETTSPSSDASPAADAPASPTAPAQNKGKTR